MDAGGSIALEASTQATEENETVAPTICIFMDREIDAMEVPDLRKYLKDHYCTKSSEMKKAELSEKIKEAVRI